MTEPLHLSTEVAAALAAGRPVVALESTLITHGLPYPANVATALAMEAAVRESGAVSSAGSKRMRFTRSLRRFGAVRISRESRRSARVRLGRM